MSQKNKNSATINSDIIAKDTKSIGAARKYYDADFRNQVIEVCNSGTYASVAECARNYGINENTLNNWIHKLKKPITINVDSEYANLKKENARLRMELEILKKATIYFASHAR